MAEGAGARFRVIGSAGPFSRALLEEVGLPELDDWARYTASKPEGAITHVPFDPHMNELGHRLYGEALADTLVEAGLLGAPTRAARGS